MHQVGPTEHGTSFLLGFIALLPVSSVLARAWPRISIKQHPESNTGRRWAGTMTVVTACLGPGVRLDSTCRQGSFPGPLSPMVQVRRRHAASSARRVGRRCRQATQFRSAAPVPYRTVPYSARSDPAGLRRLRLSKVQNDTRGSRCVAHRAKVVSCSGNASS